MIYLFRDELPSGFDVQKTLFHELLHFGLRKFLTLPEFLATMKGLYSRDASIQREADAWAKSEEGCTAAAQYGEDYALARSVDEALALQAGKAHMRHYFGDSHDALKTQPLTTLLKYPHTVAAREAKLQAADRVSD